MKKIYTRVLIILMIISVASSCTKEEDDDVTPEVTPPNDTTYNSCYDIIAGHYSDSIQKPLLDSIRNLSDEEIINYNVKRVIADGIEIFDYTKTRHIFVYEGDTYKIYKYEGHKVKICADYKQMLEIIIYDRTILTDNGEPVEETSVYFVEGWRVFR